MKKGVGRRIYGADIAPIELKVKGRQIPEWTAGRQPGRPAAPEPGEVRPSRSRS